MEQDFGARLKNYRLAKGMTQQDLADAIGVSNKTVSRWESGGGYPDVGLLVPLAEALGVTVDDLLNEKKPVRTMTRADYQQLLSFAFALGGGVLFYLTDLFMPSLVCYLAYLGCMAYGVYLQKYYTYQSRWFLLSNLVMNAAVNLSLVFQAIPAVFLTSAVYMIKSYFSGQLDTADWTGWLVILLPLLAAGALTAVTRHLIRGSLGLPPQLYWRRPQFRQLVGAGIPLAALGYWALFRTDLPLTSLYHHQKVIFIALMAALAVCFTLLHLRKGTRRWIGPGWALSAICCGTMGLAHIQIWVSTKSEWLVSQSTPYSVGSPSSRFWLVGQSTVGMAVFAAVLAAIWVALCCIGSRRPEGAAD